MAQWCLKANGHVVPRRTTRPLTSTEMSSETEKRKRKLFTELITSRWGTSASPPPDEPKPEYDFDAYEDDDESPSPIPAFDDPVDATGKSIDLQPAYDTLIYAELLLPQNGEFQPVTVTGHTVGPSGRPEGEYNEDPALNSLMYDVRFPDGDVKEYSANVIAENLMNQVDEEGFSLTTIESITAHRTTDEAVTKENMFAVNKQGVKRIRYTTCGWQLLCKWKDGSNSWIHLSTLKECNPVEVAVGGRERQRLDDSRAAQPP